MLGFGDEVLRRSVLRSVEYFTGGATVNRHFVIGEAVYAIEGGAVNRKIATAESRRTAKRIANALNLYRPKVRTPWRAEKQQLNSRP